MAEVMLADLTEQQRDIRDLAQRICSRFPDDYWRRLDQNGGFPHDFHRAIAEAGLLGVAMPEAFGGAGLGIPEAAVMMETIAASGACMSGASAVHMNIFGLNPVVVFGTQEQKQRMLPPLIAGHDKACFAVTEPNAGLDTTQIETRAERNGDNYVVHGRKIWISTAQVANKVLLLARTTPRGQTARRTDGLTLFYTDLDRSKVEVREIPKMGRHAVDSNMLFIDALNIPAQDRIGAEGEGFRILLHGLNPERILVAAEAVGIARAALRRASTYANEREVFGRRIGQNQGIQHPLAKCWMQTEAAWLTTLQAAAIYDRSRTTGEDSGLAANTAKYLAAEAAGEACQTAMLSMGGMGYSVEFDVERYLRESFITRIAPVSQQMILNFVGEKALGLPKSY